MIKVSLTYTRPSTDIPWHLDSILDIVTDLEYRTIFDEFISTEKLLVSNRILSEDSLQLTVIGYWDSYESVNEFQHHPVIKNMNLKRNEYYKKINGTVGEIIKVEVDEILPTDFL